MLLDFLPDLAPLRSQSRRGAKISSRKQTRQPAAATPPAATGIPLWARGVPALAAIATASSPAAPTSALSPAMGAADMADMPYQSTAREDVAVAILRSIAPDFAGPLYLIDSGPGNPLGLQCVDGVVGMTNPHLDMTAKPFLQNRSQWKGRGFAAVIDRSGEKYFNTVLHEAAHYCDLKWSHPAAMMCEQEFERDGWPEALALARRSPAVGVNAGGKSCTRWHGARWVRAHVHLLFRATKAAPGLKLNYDGEVAGSYYGLSSGGKYAVTLADEVMGREHESLASILMSKTPAAFNQRWLLDGGDVAQLTL